MDKGSMNKETTGMSGGTKKDGMSDGSMSKEGMKKDPMTKGGMTK